MLLEKNKNFMKFRKLPTRIVKGFRSPHHMR